MKLLLLLILITPACTVMQGNEQLGTYTYASLGGRVQNYAQTSRGVGAESIDNVESFRRGTGVIHSALWAYFLGNAVDSAAGAATKITNSNNLTKLGVQKSTDAVKIKGIEAEVATKALEVTPAP